MVGSDIRRDQRTCSLSFCHVRIKQEGGHLKARKRALSPRTESASTWILDFPAPRLLEVNVCRLSRPVCGTSLGQPEQTGQEGTGWGPAQPGWTYQGSWASAAPPGAPGPHMSDEVPALLRIYDSDLGLSFVLS